MIRASEEVVFESPECEVASSSTLQTQSNIMLSATGLVDEEGIVMNHLDPLQAFRSFHGSQLKPPGADVYSVAAGSEKRVESVYQRFQRLKSELADLTGELEEMKRFDDQALWTVLLKDSVELSQQAQALDSHEGWTQATGIISQKFSQLETRLEPNVSAVAAPLIHPKQLSSLENRVRRLECLLGQQMSGSSSALSTGADTFPIVQAIQRLEQKLFLCDSQSIENVRTKANLLKWELESLCGKKKNEAGMEAKLLEALRKMEDMSGQLTKVQTHADDLPAIVLRLKTLEGVHWSAATAQERLEVLESDVRKLSLEAKDSSSLLSEVKEGMKSNLEIIQKNIDYVEGKIAHLNSNNNKTVN